jgi:hypothetical protein
MPSGFARLCVVAVLASSPVEALDYANGRLAQECRVNSPKASCDCIIGQMAASPDGRFMLETYEVMGLPAADQKQAMLDLLNRYGMRASDAKAAMDRLLGGDLQSKAKACK